MPFAKISVKGQVTILAEVCKFLGVIPGTHLRFMIRGNTHAMGEVAGEIAGESKDD